MKTQSFHRATSLIGSIAALFVPAKGLAADALFIGSAGDHLESTGSNWVGGAPPADWSRLVFGIDVVNGLLNLDQYLGRGGITMTSGLDITIGGPQWLIMGTDGGSDGGIDMSSATGNLTINTVYEARSNMNWNVGAGRTLTISGGLAESGARSLTKDGAGTASVTTGASYSGGTTVNNGTLKATRGSLGTGAVVINNGGTVYVNDQWVFTGTNRSGASYNNPSSVTINAGGTLAFDPALGFANAITSLILNGGSVTGGTDAGYGTFMLNDGNEQITASGNTTSTISASSLGLAGGNNTITVDDGSSLRIDSAMVDVYALGADFIKAGAGTLTLTGANNYTGATTVNAGTLKSTKSSALGTTPSIAVNNAGSMLAVNYGGGSDYTEAQVATLLGKTTFGATSTLFGFDTTNGSGTYSNALTMAAGLIKLGSNTLTLTGANTYSGGTTVNDGTLTVVRGALGTGAVVINNGGTLYFNDQTVFWGANGYGGADASKPSSLTINAGGTLQLDATTGFANGITNLYLNGGSVTGGTHGGYGALFLYNGNEQITASGNTTSTISASIGLTGGNNTITVDGGSSLNITNLANSDYFGVGGFIKAGAGTLTLNGVNTYTGGTTINGGTVVLGGTATGGFTSLGYAAPTNVVTINNGGVLTGNTFNWLDGTGLASGGTNALAVVVNAGGTLKGASGVVTGLGNVTLNGGTIEVADGYTAWGWNSSFTLGGDITVSGSAASQITTASGAGAGANIQMSNGANGVGGTRTFTVNDVTTSEASDLIVSASLIDGTVVKAGAGTLELAAGATGIGTAVSWQVSAGTLSVGDGTANSALGDDSTIAIASGAVMNLNFSGANSDTVKELYLGTPAVRVPAGTYNSATPGYESYFTGDGSLVVTTGPYDAWMALYPSITGSDKLPTEDPDQDGLTNQQEFAFGLIPNNGASVNPVLVQLDKSAGTFRYQRRSSSGLTYKILTSTDLVTWPEDTGASQSAGGVDVNGNQTVTVTLSGTNPRTEPKLFVRVTAQ